jgi:hypothetical protein
MREKQGAMNRAKPGAIGDNSVFYAPNPDVLEVTEHWECFPPEEPSGPSAL